MADGDERRVIVSPRDEAAGRVRAAQLGFRLQVSNLVPPGTIYVMVPPTQEEIDAGWVRIDGLG
jgi:hypothetical protein